MSYDLKDFAKDVLERSHQVPVLVDFWAPWCGPCKMLGPIIEKLAGEAQGSWELVKVNTEEQPDLSIQYQIASIPALKLFINGQVADEILGAYPEVELRRWLETHLPSPNAGLVKEAQRLASEGLFAEAAQKLQDVLALDSGDPAAALLMAECQLALNPSAVAEILKPFGEDAEAYAKASGLKYLAGLRLTSDSLPEGKGKSAFATGLKALSKLDYATALENWIKVIEIDRQYHNEAAKTACKSVFQILGIRHPVSERFHRAFSSALYS